MRTANPRPVLAVATILLAFVALLLVGFTYYTFLSDAPRCWSVAEPGPDGFSRAIGCPPHVPDWGWALAAGAAIVLARIVLVLRAKVRPASN
jgi:hypothetical protein